MNKIKYFAGLAVFSFIFSITPVFSAEASEIQAPEEETETIIEYNISDGTSNAFDLELDYTETDTTEYIDNVSPQFLEPIDSPEYPPFNGIGYLYIEHDSGAVTGGTAFLVGKNLALTAAHCVDDPSYGNVTYMCLYVGQNGSGNRIASSTATSYFVSGFWNPSSSDDIVNDWALIKLRTSMDPTRTSILPCAIRSMAGKTIMVSGYGSEDGKLDDYQNISEGTVKSDDGYSLITNAEGRKGISGSPMLDITNFDNTVVGIVSVKDRFNHVAGPKICTSMINLINSFNSRN